MTPFVYSCDTITSPTNDITIVKASPRNFSALTFESGQYINAILKNGMHLPLSMANAPEKNGTLEFHIRHNAKHLLAEKWLCEVKQSSLITFEGPKGHSTLKRIVPGSELVFLAGGTGYAPIRSLLLSLFNYPIDKLPSIYFYWGITHPEDAYDLALIEKWKQDFPRFYPHIVLSDPLHYPHWQGPTGWVHEYCINQHPRFNHITLFASGPFEMIQAAYQGFIDKGLPSSQFICDMK